MFICCTSAIASARLVKECSSPSSASRGGARFLERFRELFNHFVDILIAFFQQALSYIIVGD